jgi:cytochrome c biogenesis protein CcdA
MSSGLLLLVLGVGLADSINPIPFAIAVLLASRSLGAVAAYVASGFVVTLAAGLVLVAGPGTALHDLLAGAPAKLVHIGQIVGGVTAIAVGVGLLLHQSREKDPGREARRLVRRSPLALGAGIAAVDLPTAFPYLGVTAAVIGAAPALGSRMLLIGLYNVCYALPLIVVVVARAVAGQRAKAPLDAVGQVVERWGPRVFSVAAIGVGVLLLVRGISGL